MKSLIARHRRGAGARGHVRRGRGRDRRDHVRGRQHDDAAASSSRRPRPRWRRVTAGCDTVAGCSGGRLQGDVVVRTASGFGTVSFQRGTVTSVSGAQLTLTEGTRRASYRSVTVTIPADAVIRDNRQRAALSVGEGRAAGARDPRAASHVRDRAHAEAAADPDALGPSRGGGRRDRPTTVAASTGPRRAIGGRRAAACLIHQSVSSVYGELTKR